MNNSIKYDKQTQTNFPYDDIIHNNLNVKFNLFESMHIEKLKYNINQKNKRQIICRKKILQYK